MKYAAGWNMPGYMPETEAEHFETSQEAMEYLQEIASWHVDDDAISATITSDEADDREDSIDTWACADDGEFGLTMGNHHYWIQRL